MTRILLSNEIIKNWPDLFRNVNIKHVPIQYIDHLLIRFIDGNTWEIKILDDSDDNKIEEFESHLFDLIKTYKDVIHELDFNIDVSRIEDDINLQIEKLYQ